MKKLILTGCLSLLGLTSFAQNLNEAISCLPQRANGYLIMNNTYHSTVTKWRVNIQTRTTNVQDNRFVYKTVKTFEVTGSYYTLIDPQYLDGTHYVQVQGLNAQGGQVTVQGPLKMIPGGEGTSWSDHCHWKCIGKKYAYQLDLMSQPDSSTSRIEMNPTEPPLGSNEPHYYEWVSESAWPSFSSGSPSFYGLSSFDPNANGSPGSVIHIELPQGTHKTDAYNVPITGWVYGVKKNFGPWMTYDAMITSSNITGQDLCSNSYGFAEDRVNAGPWRSNPNIPASVPNLDCNGVSFGEYDPSTPPPPDMGDMFSTVIKPCLDFYINELVGPEQLTPSALGLIYSMDCGEESNGFAWPPKVNSVEFKTVYDPSGMNASLVLAKNTFIDPSGKPLAPAINLKSGFYIIGVTCADGSYTNAFVELKKPVKETVKHADFVKVTPFPVPVTGNSFSLKIQSSANLKARYLLLDVNGTVLYEDTYILTKDQSQTQEIRVKNIPSGVLINRLTFQDGSQIQFQTIK